MMLHTAACSRECQPIDMEEHPHRYGRLDYTSRCPAVARYHHGHNIGDFTQALVSEQYFPRIDATFDRDTGSLSMPQPAPTYVWMNAWWGEKVQTTS